MSCKYLPGTILRSIDKHKLYIVTPCKDINAPCEGCAFNNSDCYERVPKELGIDKSDCVDILGEGAVFKAIEGGL